MDGIDFKNVISAAELVRLQWRPHGWVLWQMIPQGGITLLAGETASGKSFLGLDLALGMASARGKAWDMELGESQESAKPPILSDTDTLPRFTDPPSREGNVGLPYVEEPCSIAEGREGYVGLPQVEDPCSEAKGRRAGSSRETDGRLMRENYQSSSTAESTRLFEAGIFDGPHLPLIPLSRAPLRGDLASTTNNGDLALGIASGRGKAWDMELGEEIADKKIEFQNPSVDDTTTVEQTRPVPYNVQLKDPSQAQDDNTHRVRYFCGDADPNLVAERVLRLCRGYPDGKKGMGIDVPEALDLDFTAHAFSDPESFRWLQKEVVRQGYSLLIFDGLAQYLPGMADGSASAVGAFLRGLRQLTSQTGVSVVLIHQFNKRLASRLNKWGLPTSQGEERVRGSSELLAGVDSVLLLSRPEAMKLGGMGRAVLKVVKNRLGQAGARLQFTIVDGDSSLHLLFERLGAQAQPKPRRLVDAAFDEMMRILMTEDERKFDRRELTRLLQDRMNLPGTRTLAEAFGMLGRDERVRIERKEGRKSVYSWAEPGTGALEKRVYGLPPAMALDFASSYLLTKARLNLAEQEMEKMKNKASSTELLEQLADMLKRDDEGEG